MKTFTTVFALLFITVMTASAQTGSFNTTISFGAENRTLSCYVPTNYDSTQSYRLMICLHGLGDNSNNYRNALINSLNWPATFTNTIFVCPDGGSDPNKDFYQPQGDQEIIATAIQFATGKYTIDTHAVLLQGFSLGGRSALKYGLEHPDMFDGLLLNTPALQGLMDAQNNPMASLVYNYANAAQLPVFVTVGETDYTYNYQVGALVQLLKKNNTPVQFELVTGLGHSIPGGTISQKSFSFLVNRQIPPVDADVFELNTNRHFCTNNIQTTCLVRNNGDSTIHSLGFTLSTGTTTITQQWNGTILPNHYAVVPLAMTVPAGGTYTFTATIVAVNGGTLDAIAANNKLEQTIDVATTVLKPIVTQTFDEAANEWFIHSSGSMFEWYMDDQVKRSGKNSIASFNTALLFYTRNAVESFSSPYINIAGLAKKELNFDLAFTYYRYTPPYIANETNFADTLEVLISTDCGATYTSLYKKGGQQLATKAEPIINALNMQACMFIPTTDQWRTETIDLSNFANADKAVFKFSCISGMGGSLNIDNFSFGGSYVGVNETSENDNHFNLYPNPASESVTLDLPAGASGDVIIMDITGKIVLTQPIENLQQHIALSHIPEGMYLAQITLGGQSIIQKLLIRK
ncbi:MAG: T9SS type A sorting domain-containing protein [Bacteroidota bacterium]